MSLTDKIRAWKDPAYRNSLSQAEFMALPENPAGIIELSGTDLDFVSGGGKSKGGGGGGCGRRGHKRGCRCGGRGKGSSKSSKSRKSKKSGKSCKSS